MEGRFAHQIRAALLRFGVHAEQLVESMLHDDHLLVTEPKCGHPLPYPVLSTWTPNAMLEVEVVDRVLHRH